MSKEKANILCLYGSDSPNFKQITSIKVVN